MSEWLPIEAAPKDGTRILGYDGHDVSITYASKFFRLEWLQESSIASDRDGTPFHLDWHPTYWMPLPEPPK